LPHSVEAALAIDRRTDTDFWQLGYKHIDCHMVFDVKMDITRKARFVAGGHQTDQPKESTYSSVVLRDSVRIAFLIAALSNLDILLAGVQNADKKLHSKVTTPMTQSYRVELDTTPELDAKRGSYYQGLIGVLRWMCELGRLDILVNVAMLSRYLAAPREGDLEQVFHIFGYLKSHGRSSLVLDDTEPFFDEDRFKKFDWTKYYPDAGEEEPPRAPELRGRSVNTSRVMHSSHTGVLIFVNRASILCYSKRQNTVEASTFGSEFVAMKSAVEMIEGMRYKLRMFGISVDEETNVFCDNEALVHNSTKPESTLMKSIMLSLTIARVKHKPLVSFELPRNQRKRTWRTALQNVCRDHG
jgi:hypothetical protein